MKNSQKNSLKNYNSKRDFSQTIEPPPAIESQDSGDYMIHYHTASQDHYDLRLQWKGVLQSWAIPKGPSCDPKTKRLAIRTENHPDDYKAFEGVIPEDNYGAGPTLIWDAGKFVALENFERGLKEGHIRFSIDGIKLKGAWNLILMKNKSSSEFKDLWLLIKESDQFAFEKFDIRQLGNESVATGRTVSDLQQESY